MLAIQFQTTNEPIVRDTRDAWELREAIKVELEEQANLHREIRKYEQTIENYESKRRQSQEVTLRENLQELKEEAGLTDVSGPGITITIQNMFDEPILGQASPQVSADLLRKLINELNINGAKHIAISEQRYVNTSAIRDVNGFTNINNTRIPDVPVEVKIISEDVDRLYKRMVASESIQFEFEIEGLKLQISSPTNHIMIPGYDDTIRIKHMEPDSTKEGS
ncbi:DUF881 domain-containing protein [Bacillus sp. RD4P76]|uniref:DUF881 domain-containing protein n=2 Tax=Bacillus suaedaesalsae TaxID=2810349 RepID=A0ABS2DJ59_9BACI|nr:DUF881 domain-containing protein [Bacillus suaedaesalsae]